MKELINQWFEQSAPFQGIMACGVRHSDQSAVAKVWADGFTEMVVESARRCVADLFQVLHLNRIPPGRVRWVYQGVFLHCERRPDGACLGIFVPKDADAVDPAGLDRFFGEFKALAQAAPL